MFWNRRGLEKVSRVLGGSPRHFTPKPFSITPLLRVPPTGSVEVPPPRGFGLGHCFSLNLRKIEDGGGWRRGEREREGGGGGMRVEREREREFELENFILQGS